MPEEKNDKLIYEGPIFKVVKRPVNGSFDHDAVIHPPVVVVVPILGTKYYGNGVVDKELILIRQTRPLIGKSCLELPAGFIEDGESVIEASGRELLEETGYKANVILEMFSFYSSPGFTDEKVYVTFALDMEKVAEPKNDSGEIIEEVISCSFTQALKFMRDGEITSGGPCMALMYSALHYGYSLYGKK